MAIAVIHGNKTWTKGYGYADLEAEEPVTPFTLFHGASTTKAQTASLAALVVQDSETYKDINWDTKLHSIDPLTFQLQSQYESSEVTLLDALSHRTGMPRHDLSWVNTNATIEDQVKSLRHLSLSASFRTKWQYCNLMYTAVAHALEQITQQTIGKLYTSWLWQPLGMNQTFFSNEDASRCQSKDPSCKLSKHYTWSSRNRAFTEYSMDSVPPINGAGGVISNINDYAKWVRALAQAAGPVSKEGHEALRSPLSVAQAKDTKPFDGPEWYGMGLSASIYRGHMMYFHNGAIGGYYSRITFVPILDWGFAIMQNAPNSGLDVVAFRIIDDFLKIPMEERFNAKTDRCSYWNQWEERVNKVKGMPAMLYPSVAKPPTLPALQPSSYAGKYTHPGYGTINLVSGVPSNGSHAERVKDRHDSGIFLYAETSLLEVLFVFEHVSGENWLVELWEHEMMDDDIPTGYSKAKTEIGADGQVEAIHVITEAAVTGDKAWTTFRRTE
ncbi:hypothetical protein ANO11243_074820 [Dothideomycetidae sp. 11243]|nr:hypothetical protein ANO11243_074820 [fungal sp. No.11243]